MEIPPVTKWTSLLSLTEEISGMDVLKFLFDNSTLAGGTALSLKLQHRMSYDLDFAWTENTVLPYRLLRRCFLDDLPGLLEGIQVREMQTIEKVD